MTKLHFMQTTVFFQQSLTEIFDPFLMSVVLSNHPLTPPPRVEGILLLPVMKLMMTYPMIFNMFADKIRLCNDKRWRLNRNIEWRN